MPSSSKSTVYVPHSIRTRSRVVSWLWRISASEGGWNRDAAGFRRWLTYEPMRKLARWLP